MTLQGHCPACQLGPSIHTLVETGEHFRVSPKKIRRLAATRQVSCMRGNRGAYLFTPGQLDEIETCLTQPAVENVTSLPRRRRAS